MPSYRSIRVRRARKKIQIGFNLQLTAMLDILVVILVFLLKSQATGTTTFQSLPGLEMPYSRSPTIPVDSLHLIITPAAITFEEDKIIEFDEKNTKELFKLRRSDLDDRGMRIMPLFDALVDAREKAELLRAKSSARDEESGKPLPFTGVLAVQADKQVPYGMLRRIMYTAATAGYRAFQFLAMKRDQE